MDAAAIPQHLLTDYFFRLSLVDLDRAAANLEKLGYEDHLEDAWFVTMFAAIRAGRKDIGDRMMALRRPFGLKEEDLRLSQRLLLARDEPSKWLRLVEEAARNGLKTENADGLLDLAFSVAMSDQSALGLILYRGILPFVPPDKVGSNYENIVLPVRERLNVPADDPLKEYLDNRSVDADLALQEAEAKFEAKRSEVRALRESLEQLQKDLVFGTPTFDAQLEANKMAYFNDFVARPDFADKYPSTLTNAQYVDNLLTTANLTPSETRLFVTSLTNSQEVPPTTPTTSTGGARPASFGTAKFQLNSAQTAMTFTATINNIDVSGSQTADTNDNLIAAHIHAGATVAPGVNGPVVWGFFGTPFNDNNPNDSVNTPFSNGVGGTFSGKWDAPEGNGTTLAAQLTNLRTGHAYINFHTTQFTGGEIRGNIPAENAFRDSLVAGLNGGTMTRAQVLRAIAEAEELQNREFNAAFVAMEYFGYLRRDPDTAGFNFWLNKLNAFNGNFIQAEMVKAFISSSEFRQRFGAS